MRQVPPPLPPPPPELAPIVLVAEDDDELRRLVARRLRRIGCDVLEARTGVQLTELVIEHGVPTVAERPVSLVVSDVRMPGRSGLDVLRLLRRAGVDVPVLLLTAFGSDELAAEAARLGAVVCDKPIDLDDLATMARELIRWCG